MLMVLAHGCMMTHMMYIFPLHGGIHGWLMVFPVQHAVTIFCETPLRVPSVKGTFISHICDFFSLRHPLRNQL